jgi:hypothetical protein
MNLSAQMDAQMSAQMMHECTGAVLSHTMLPIGREHLCVHNCERGHLSTSPILGVRLAYLPTSALVS